jgi:hypothetical protein
VIVNKGVRHGVSFVKVTSPAAGQGGRAADGLSRSLFGRETGLPVI